MNQTTGVYGIVRDLEKLNVTDPVASRAVKTAVNPVPDG